MDYSGTLSYFLIVNRIVIIVVVALVCIWGGASLVVWWARSTAPTPQSVASLAESNILDQVPNRDVAIRDVAKQLNRLSFDQRRELRSAPAFTAFTQSMTPEETSLFLDLTLPEGFRQLMIALNAMTPERRKEIVDRALKELNENGDRRGDGPQDEANARKVVSEGMSAFYEEASVDVKLDFAPVIEQIQRSLQGGR